MWPHGIRAQTGGAVPASAAAAAAVEPEWPRTYGVAGGYAVMYTPQVASWDQQTRMVAWSAVSFYPTGAATPAQGVIRIEATTRVAIEDRLVDFSDLEITESHFSTLPPAEAEALVRNLKQAVPVNERVIALDRVLAAVDKSAVRTRNVPDVKADPPKIFTSTKPAVLMVIDGDVVWSPIRGVELQWAVNTNWDLFQHTATKTFYLRNEASWYKAAAIAGPWSPAGTLPPSFAKLPADENFKDVRAHVPGAAVAAGAMPVVFVSTEPAELLLLNGPPSYQAVPGTSLLWVSNTDSDLFRAGKAGAFYYLVAGRWFSAPDINGPWTFATPTLPADFRRIPLDHVRSRVLASVPGTDEANEAVLLATIPQTARVNRNQVKAPEVVYQGDPEFDPIAPTTVARGVNTDEDVFKIGDRYYLCHQAIWFVSATATGPWEVATSVPDVIYDIPPSSPSHNVTYVTIEDDDPADEWVTFAYVAGYTGMMIAWGCAVWGTGWYYPPYVRYGGFHPVYYGFPRTYGFSAWYNPYTGNFGRAAAVYGPFGGAGAVAVYNPRSGTYARGAAAYGPYGSRSVGHAFNPRAGAYAQTRQGANVYGNWGSTAVQRGDGWARSAPSTAARAGTTARGAQAGGSPAASTRPAATPNRTPASRPAGDVYAGHDGNVYQRGTDGSWQQWNKSGWQSGTQPGAGAQPDRSPGVAQSRPSTTRPDTQLNRDAGARTAGNQRTQSLDTYRSAPSRSAAGSYRGGGARGGRR
jgi:hypothetical protein